VIVIDAVLGTPSFEPVSYQNPRSMEWNADGTHLAISGGQDAVVLDATTGSVVVTLPSRGESTLAASFRASLDEIATASSSGGLRIHRTAATGGDVATLGLQITRALIGGGEEVMTGSQLVDVGVTADHVVVSLTGAGTAMFDRETGGELHSRAFKVDTRVYAPVAKDAAHVAGIYENGSAGVIEAATLRDASRLPGCAAPTGTSPDGRYFVLDRSLLIGDACAAGDAIAGIYDVTNEQLAIEYGGERLVHGAISNPAGSEGPRYAAVAVYEEGSEVGRVDLWNVDSGALVASVDDETRPGFLPSHVSFSPDARHLAIGTHGPIALVLDVAALADGATLGDATRFDREVHTSRSPRAILTDDGTLATGSGDGTYRFWDVETGEMTMQLETTGILGNGVFDFSPDFESFYYEDGGGIVRRMPMDVDEMIDLAGSLVTRSLTDAECREYLHLDACAEGGD
jgi:WD40 repeat protein